MATVHRPPHKKMIPCYLDLDAYLMLKHMADEDMRSMSAFLKVLVFQEAMGRDLTPDMFKEEANEQIKADQKILAEMEG